MATAKKVMSQAEADERAVEADRLIRYALSDREGVARETAETEARLTAKYA